MTTHIMIVGTGVMARQLSLLIGASANYAFTHLDAVPERPQGDIDVAVVVSDSWNPGLDFDAEISFRENGIPWLRGFAVLGEGVVGPLVVPGAAGCSQCADTRRIMADADRVELWQLKSYLMADEQQSGRRDAWLSGTAALHMSYLLYNKIQHFLLYPEGGEVHDMTVVQLNSLATSTHKFLPDPKCSVCGGLPVDAPEQARIALEPTPKLSVDTYRTKSLGALKRGLADSYLDAHSGLLNSRVQDLIAPYAAVGVNLPLFVGDEGASGRSQRYKEAELTAILEGLERYCGIEPRGKTGFVTDTYARLGENALDPASVGLHDSERYQSPGFPFQQLSPDTPMEWVWGYSMTQEKPLLVPKLLAYYSLGYNPGFVYETSNGCAIGGSLVEAVFHGILEVVERDAFLMTWYARLPLPPIDIESVEDVELDLMLKRLRAVVGYDVYFFNATMENGIPSVFAVAKNRRGRGLNLMCAAGSHPDALKAVKGAVHEIAGMLLRFDDKLEHHKGAYLEMLSDSSLVREMDEHSMLYGLPEAEERLSFLLNSAARKQTFAEAFPVNRVHEDLAEDLGDLLNGFRELNLDVVVVNQTSPEIEQNDLHCVKVLIPGMLPMTFGNHLVRLEGLQRVFSVPVKLGYRNRPLTKADLNPYPHPFP
ncbi:TOMM precursor leader peptide-binding protein [Alicyclobacillus sp. SO9]|uniref:TOMM precursor leader peptide-binding protein n=1 Tax=Alicyclobacillus sp. SO9 TaxID=2665646 RepID=UPI0018E732B8|nr:TOMM precursor leader peptide-binding protein [Alicyclobacillus sp. SO9]QQE77540.1 TOMM precursor leader peptide-binding protein [Alicyclobacillus sp. SO9]